MVNEQSRGIGGVHNNSGRRWHRRTSYVWQGIRFRAIFCVRVPPHPLAGSRPSIRDLDGDGRHIVVRRLVAAEGFDGREDPVHDIA
jgi:hypothetical protein